MRLIGFWIESIQPGIRLPLTATNESTVPLQCNTFFQARYSQQFLLKILPFLEFNDFWINRNLLNGLTFATPTTRTTTIKSNFKGLELIHHAIWKDANFFNYLMIWKIWNFFHTLQPNSWIISPGIIWKTFYTVKSHWNNDQNNKCKG